ncbi:methyltransferase domain-containing protein [Patescibacteria group bacterium]|nr:methyltransferase domain-containing protein [Patescibacteria group bacterium]
MINAWDKFSEEKLKKIFTEKNMIIDIGGGLRVNASKGNRLEEKNKWLEPYIEKVDYKVLDKVVDYNPDIVGDIQSLPLEDNSVDAFICNAILEHVEEPQKAVKEMYRVLKPGGYCFIYVPFLYYYHPMKGYYKDFYRFTYDGVKYMCRDFSQVEIQNVRGALSSVMNLIPMFSKRTKIFDWIDKLFGKSETKQTSGYIIFCEK